MHSIEHLSGQLRSLRLNSLSQAAGNLIAQAEENELSYLQFAQQLFDHELQSRNHRRIEINQRKAGFPVEKPLEEFDYRAQSSISKRQVNQLLDFSFIDERDNLIFIGPLAWVKPIWPLVLAKKPFNRATRSCSPQPWNW